MPGAPIGSIPPHVNVRNAPSMTGSIIGTFYSYGIDMDGNIIYDYEGPSAKITQDRSFTPVHIFVLPDHTWVLLDYNRSRGWIREDLVDISDCGTLPTGPSIEIGLGPSLPLPTVVGPAGVLDPYAIWPPFGECLHDVGTQQSRRRCAYEIYAQLYEDLIDQGIELSLKKVVAAIMQEEVGAYFDGYRRGNSLNASQSFIAEAMMRNITQICFDQLNQLPNGFVECNMYGLLDYLQGLHGWYHQHGKITESILYPHNRPGLEIYEDIADHLFDNTSWATGLISDRPFTWGNWTSLASPVAYFSIELLIEQHGHNGIFVLGSGQLPIQSTFYAEAGLPCSGNRDITYAFAITANAHPYGATSACP